MRYIEPKFMPFEYKPIKATPTYKYCNKDMIPDFAPNNYPPERFAMIRCLGIMLGWYYISTYGRIYSMVSKRFLRLTNNNGYRSVNLSILPGISKSFSVHRLVAITFIPKTRDDIINERHFINHKNLIRNDNYVWNLEWVNHTENIRHAFNNDARGKNRNLPENNYEVTGIGWGCTKYGEDSSMSRLTNQQVMRICEGLEKRQSYGECCELAGINNNARNRNIICNIARGDRWQWLSCRYNIPKDNIRELTDYRKFIIPVCKLLAKKMRTVDIIKELNLQGDYDRVRMFISGIKNKKTYTKISNEYF